MAIFNSSKFFKLILLSFVAVLFLIAATRNTISQTVQVNDLEEEKDFLIHQVKKSMIANGANQVEETQNSSEEKVLDNVDTEDVVEVEATQETIYEDLPGAYLKDATPAAQNHSYCKFNYDVPFDLIYKSAHVFHPPEQGNASLYRVLYNVTEAYATESASQVTYATHMTANFAYFIPELLKRWDGLISVAAFVPDLDSAFFIEQITHFCYCEPLMHRVSVHMVTHKSIGFSKKDINFGRPGECAVQDSAKVPILGDFDDTVVYPINVIRNVARTAALTKYVLLGDVELMPSRGLAGDFLQMLRVINKTETKEVFVLPTFEVEKGESVPETKRQLQELLQTDKAVYFHQVICPHCQRFPGIDRWMKEGNPDSNVKPFITVKRVGELHRWEPFYIGTNEDPLFSEKLSWEGLQDKMTQNLEMCLQDYNYTVLDNAFLCHWPGIKRDHLFEEDWRKPYIEENRIAYREVIEEFQKRYNDLPGCQLSFLVPNNTATPQTK